MSTFDDISFATESSYSEAESSRAAQPSAPLAGRRCVLVVDDEADIAGLIKISLEARFGVEVQSAGNGREAISRLQQRDFDLVISDVRMPEMDGMALYRWVDSHRPHLRRRFFFMTGWAGGNPTAEQLEGFGVAVLDKPFTLNELARTCGAHLAA